MSQQTIEFFGEPISVYLAKQAVEDGYLVDVSHAAKFVGGTGFDLPVIVTMDLFEAINDIPPSQGH